jgi:hypothetical protein
VAIMHIPRYENILAREDNAAIMEHQHSRNEQQQNQYASATF